MPRPLRLLAAGLALAAAACAPGFQLDRFEGNESLFTASLAEFQEENWDNAIAGFERLTLQLPARDTLLPRAHWYLGVAHQQRDEHLLAAQSFVRIVESFPADTLGDDALFEAARSYQRLWRKPELDAQYGETAIGTYQTLLSAYPDSPLREDAEREILNLQEWLARKDYGTGDYYLRRRAYDSAIIYFRDVVEQFPATPSARRSSFRLLEIYRTLNYQEEVAEVCAGMRTRYPSDPEVAAACPAPAAPDPAAAPPATTPPPAAG